MSQIQYKNGGDEVISIPRWLITLVVFAVGLLGSGITLGIREVTISHDLKDMQREISAIRSEQTQFRNELHVRLCEVEQAVDARTPWQCR